MFGLIVTTRDRLSRDEELFCGSIDRTTVHPELDPGVLQETVAADRVFFENGRLHLLGRGEHPQPTCGSGTRSPTVRLYPGGSTESTRCPRHCPRTGGRPGSGIGVNVN